ncbi:MAG: class B sortase [Clostridiales bacterium]|nr:class B sortase [Clostridiales bacterium]
MSNDKNDNRDNIENEANDINNTDMNSTDGAVPEQPEKKKKSAKLILIFILVFLLLFGGIMLTLELCDRNGSTPDEDIVTTQSTTEKSTVENPIDFDTLQEGNNEIYAWLIVDDTNIDYPIVQSKSDDEFYLKHKAEDKSWSASGAVYTESANNTAFTDPVTVVYGHNGYSDTMFTTLHYFEDEEFFDNHPYFYIYTPVRKLTYQVVSAFKYDNRHILNSFDFSNEDVLTDFLDMIQNPDSSMKNVRTKLDTQITTDSNIVILSTCITNQKSSRYLVCGVLVKK